MEISAVELFGYAASAVVAYSLTQSSIIRLRWINLFGSSSFCAYGIIIGAYPVAILNGFIALTNVFFLRKMLLHTEDNFAILKVSRPSNYVDFFLEYHKEEIDHLFPRFMKDSAMEEREYYFMTEHTEVVGMLSGYLDKECRFIVDFDFVTPKYRDCKLGQFVLGQGQELRNITNYNTIVATADSPEHESYLVKLGYVPGKDGYWVFNNSVD